MTVGNQELGRSPSGRATAAEPKVSALRASIPSALAERRAIAEFHRVLALRAVIRLQRSQPWHFLTRLRARWLIAAHSNTAEAIERGEHHGTQSGWIVDLSDGVFFAREGRQMIRDRDAAPREREAVEAEGQQPGPEQSEGIAND